jgi:hypothetical protein
LRAQETLRKNVSGVPRHRHDGCGFHRCAAPRENVLLVAQMGRDAMTTQDLEIIQLVDSVRAEYDALPGMHLTKAQLRRLFDLDPVTCDALVGALEDVHFLRRLDSQYVRAAADE